MFVIFSILEAAPMLKLGYSKVLFNENNSYIFPSNTGVKYAIFINISESNVICKADFEPGSTYIAEKSTKGETPCYVISYPADTNCIITYNYNLLTAQIPGNTILLEFSSTFVVAQFLVNSEDASNVFLSTSFEISESDYHASSSSPRIDICGVNYFSIYNKGTSPVNCSYWPYMNYVYEYSNIFGTLAYSDISPASHIESFKCIAPEYYYLFEEYSYSQVSPQNGLTIQDISTTPHVFVAFDANEIDSIVCIGNNRVIPLKTDALPIGQAKYAIIASDQYIRTDLAFSPEITVKVYNGATKSGTPSHMSDSTFESFCNLLEITKMTDIPSNRTYIQGIVGSNYQYENSLDSATLYGTLFDTALTTNYIFLSTSYYNSYSPGPFYTRSNYMYLFQPGHAAFYRTYEEVKILYTTNVFSQPYDGNQLFISSSLYDNSLILSGNITDAKMIDAQSYFYSIIYYNFEDVIVNFFAEESFYYGSSTSGYIYTNQLFYHEIVVPPGKIAGFISSTYSGNTIHAPEGGLSGSIATNIYPLLYRKTLITITDSVIVVARSSEYNLFVAVFVNPGNFQVNGEPLKTVIINPSKMEITGSGILESSLLNVPETTYLSVVVNMDKAHYIINPPDDLTQKYVFILVSSKSFKYNFHMGNKVSFTYYTGDGTSAGSDRFFSSTYTDPIYGVLTFDQGAGVSYLDCIAQEPIPTEASKFVGPAGDGFINFLTGPEATIAAVEIAFPVHYFYMAKL